MAETKTIKALKKSGVYRLYKIEKHYELWNGVYGDDVEKGIRIGYVADPRNFDYAVDVAIDEARIMMAELRAEFGGK